MAFFRSPEVEDGNQLQPPDTAPTVRVDEGGTIRTAGPFAGTREPLGGYVLDVTPGCQPYAVIAVRRSGRSRVPVRTEGRLPLGSPTQGRSTGVDPRSGRLDPAKA
jgi:hypothetical protein